MLKDSIMDNHNALLAFQKLEWDSEFFGYGVARLEPHSMGPDELRSVLLKLIHDNIKLVYWSVDPMDLLSNESALMNKGLLVDKKTSYSITLSSQDDKTTLSDCLQSYLFKPMNSRLVSLACQSGIKSRYHIDPHFIHNEFERLYTTWLVRSLQKEIADDVLVYVEDGVELGLITLAIRHDAGCIGLLAVDEQTRGQSIGKQLVNAACARLSSLGCNRLNVVTQKSNLSACRFYEKLGFHVEKIENIYHFWLN